MQATDPQWKKQSKISKKNNVSIGAHPSFKDPENFVEKDLIYRQANRKLIIDQINILSNVANNKGMKVTHVKPHGALNNMACENYDLAKVISEAIIQVNKE